MKATSALRVLERACWVVGVALLVGYGVARGLGGVERREAVAAFELDRGATSVADERSVLGQPVPPFAPDERRVDARPDMSRWSDARRRRYAAVTASPDSAARPVAVLRIARVQLEVPVYVEESERNMNRGAVLVTGTAPLNGDGNVAIAAHRDGFFRVLEEVAVGDVVEVDRLDGARRYRVTTLTIVSPEDTHVLQPTPGPVLTLVTCYPFRFVGSAPRRYVVRAVAAD